MITNWQTKKKEKNNNSCTRMKVPFYVIFFSLVFNGNPKVEYNMAFNCATILNDSNMRLNNGID